MLTTCLGEPGQIFSIFGSAKVDILNVQCRLVWN